jgi:Asp-tRNA(Asn)/Glu-tRNA(Gln) amidotransferase A subunit family amidase
MVPFALGTQTGGSMIRPAAYCGVVGFKPTFGLVPRDGMRVICPSLDVIGWHSRDVRLASRVADVLLPGSRVSLESSRSLRIGYMAAHPGYTLGEAAARTLENARMDLEMLAQTVVPIHSPPQVERLLEAHGIVMHYELSQSFRDLPGVSEHLLSPSLREAIRRGADLPKELYVDRLRFREVASGDWDSYFGPVDLVLTSSVLGPAPLGISHTGESGFNKAWSLLGWPCIHLPTTVDGLGLPLGVLLVARPGFDHELLNWAEFLHPMIDRRSTYHIQTN